MSRTLWLLRHAKSDWSTGAPDHERPLNERGRGDAVAVGRLLAERGWRPDLVLCSSAQRTRQTWERAQRGGATAGAFEVEPRIYEADTSALLDVVRGVDDDVSGLMLIGHGPGIPALVDLLGVRPEPEDLWRRVDEKFPTSALAVLELDSTWADADSARLVAYEVPRG